MSTDKQTTQHFDKLDKEILRRILKFSIVGIAHELKDRQEKIIVQKLFGDTAVTYPDSYNPLRKRSTNNDKQDYDNLVSLAELAQHLLDHVIEMRSKEFAEIFKGHINKRRP